MTEDNRKYGRAVLIYLSIKYDGDWNSIWAALKKRETVSPEDAYAAEASLKCRAVTVIDDDYPARLRTCLKPPIVLFYYGDLGVLDNKTIGIIGSRHPSSYGQKMTEELALQAAKEGHTVVNGMAIGVDSLALRKVLEIGGKAVAVLGSGIDNCYPTRHSEIYESLKIRGLVVSEYPMWTPPSEERFPVRNRIVASLSDALLITEGNQKSGTRITADFALEMGKNVGCVPYHSDEESICNSLIKEGAAMVENGDDLRDLIQGL